MSVRRWCAVTRRRWSLWALGALCALLAAGRPRLPVDHSSQLALAVSPERLAHLLADFSYHPPVGGSWVVEEESGNHTAWSYSVTYECGARCAGRARVEVREEREGRPSHGPPRALSVLVEHSACRALPLLPWPRLCDETEVRSRVWGDGAGGAVLAEAARARCGPLAALSGACRAALHAARHAHHTHLRNILASA